jgi:hypothetical protein
LFCGKKENNKITIELEKQQEKCLSRKSFYASIADAAG